MLLLVFLVFLTLLSFSRQPNAKRTAQEGKQERRRELNDANSGERASDCYASALTRVALLGAGRVWLGKECS